ncbi:MAG: hypothetical protein GWO08_19230, partial [Gammaproteobacteria bacterium]|nr:hypothetical protein [Phycisphaerae bacterium]NIR95690.1 hypothetical protein [Gammaproteobacteria bacterium]
FAATPNDTDAPTSLFFNLEFTTFGIKPGTEVMCDVSNGDLGAVTTNSVVSGNLQAGSFNVEYTLANGSAGGTQILTCMVELPNPSSFGPQCASVPLEDRKINAEVVITQNAAGDIANPPPDPAPTSMVCNPSTIQEGNSGTCTCVNSNAAGEEICFNGDTDISFPDTCSTADVDGVAIVLYDAGLIPDESSINTVSCGPSGGDGSLDPGDPFAQTNITVTQETPVVAGNLSCTPNPAIAGDELVCTCTSNAEPGSELCFENTEMMTSVVSFPGAPDNCVVADGNGNGVVIADATATLVPINNILQCCVNSNMDSDCDEETVAQLVQLVNPVTVGDITVDVVANPSLVNFLGQSILTGTISGLPPGTQGCFDVFIEGSGITNGGGTTDPVINGVTTPVCATTDANGDIIVIYTAGDAEGIDTIRFCHDADTSDTCDAGETADLVQITVEAAAPPPPAMVECTSNPGTVIPGNDSSINASFANLPAGFDFACFQFLSQTSPESTLTSPSEANQTDAVCVPINNDIAAAVFTANAGIIAPQNAFVSCCAGTMGGAGDDCTQAGALLGLPALVTVDPAPVSPFTISIGSTSGVTTTMAGDSEGLDLATNPPVPSGTQLCVELTFE